VNQTTADIQALTQEGILTNHLAANENRNNCPLRLSSAGKCKRQVALKTSLAEERPLDYEAAAMFSHGNMRGEQMAAGLVTAATAKQMAVMLETEHWLEIPNPDSDDGLWDTKMTGELFAVLDGMFGEKDLPVRFTVVEARCHIEVRGRSDAILIDTDSKVTVVENKTMNPYSFKRTVNDPDEKIDAAYKCQLASYVVAFEEENPEVEMMDPVFLFEDKAFHANFKHHTPVEEMRDLVNTMVRPQYALLFKAIVAGKQREVSPDFGPNQSGKLPWNCNYCDVAAACWRNAGLTNKKPGQRIPEYFVTSTRWQDGEAKRMTEREAADAPMPSEQLKKDAPY